MKKKTFPAERLVQNFNFTRKWSAAKIINKQIKINKINKIKYAEFWNRIWG
jgi:hypothetical protein